MIKTKEIQLQEENDKKKKKKKWVTEEKEKERESELKKEIMLQKECSKKIMCQNRRCNGKSSVSLKIVWYTRREEWEKAWRKGDTW